MAPAWLRGNRTCAPSRHHPTRRNSPAQRRRMIALAPRAPRRPALPCPSAPGLTGEHSAWAWRKGRPRGGRAGGVSFVFNAVTRGTQRDTHVYRAFACKIRGLSRVQRLGRSRAHMECLSRAEDAPGMFSYARARRTNRTRQEKGDKSLYLSMERAGRALVTARTGAGNKKRGIGA